jgi:hypothetical protein
MISAVSSKWWLVEIATLAGLVVLFLPVVMIMSSRITYTVANRRYGVLALMFLDKQTNTYSLSKFQFYAWTAAAIVGYLNLTFAQSLVQGTFFVVADIPANLPGIVFISGTTTAIAQGITAARGAKGAGPIYPCLADFVTTGGVVAAERFQFFVWTIVGVSSFLFLVVFSHPANLSDLPKIPNGFLALMGASSVGYLGGKLARKPGPIIYDITPTVDTLFLQVRGQKLSKNASFKIDGTNVITASAPATGTDPDDVQSSDLFKKLTVVIGDPDSKWQLPGWHEVTLMNPDGQEAQWFYILPSKPLIENVTAGASETTLQLRVEGHQLSQDASFKIGQDDVKAEHGSVASPGVPDGEAPMLFKSLTLIVTKPDPRWLKPGDFELTVINPDRQRATSPIYKVG